jgi:hypothetical protein
MKCPCVDCNTPGLTERQRLERIRVKYLRAAKWFRENVFKTKPMRLP